MYMANSEPDPKTILVVDDDLSVLSVIKCMLECGDYNVLMAHNAESALRMADRDDLAIDLMLIDVVNSGWAPVYTLNLSEDVPGYMNAPATALSYPWQHLIAGHLGRLGTRDDVTVHQQYIADIEAGARTALATVDPVPVLPEVRRQPPRRGQGDRKSTRLNSSHRTVSRMPSSA